MLFIHLLGMLRRWDDSQRFLADMPQLICEETSNYLILWCMRLQQEGVMYLKAVISKTTKELILLTSLVCAVAA